MNILITLLFGAIAGWLAGFFVIKEKGGLIWNIIIGLLGGVVGGWLLGKLGATGSFWTMWYGQIICAVIGAVGDFPGGGTKSPDNISVGTADPLDLHAGLPGDISGRRTRNGSEGNQKKDKKSFHGHQVSLPTPSKNTPFRKL